MADESDYYAVLGVAPGANETAIRLAFRRLARRYHPDVAESGDAGRMARINEAYRVLGDPERRRTYDLSRDLASPAESSTKHHARPTAAPATPEPGTLRASAGPLRRMAVLATGERTPVTALAFARGGQLAAAGLIDGRVVIWDVAASRPLHTLHFASATGAGVLQEVRLAPSGAYAAAWGLLLGTRVWHVPSGQALWTSSANGPSGAMDVVLLDEPPRVRLALPDAPLALAGDDPFRWAHQGRAGSAIFTRPLVGPVEAQWAVPRRCVEANAAASGGRGAARGGWRVYERMLSADGQRLLTFNAPPSSGAIRSTALHVWDLESRSLLGGATVRRVAHAAYPAGVVWFPLAATPDLAWVATGYRDQRMRVAATQWHAERLVETGPLPSDARVALAPDAALLAVAHAARLDLWLTADHTPPQSWELAADVTALSFAAHANAPLLGIGLGNGVVELWGV